jgi:hypothetical protein
MYRTVPLLLVLLVFLPSRAQDANAREFLQRDLTSYFCKGYKDCHVEFELLQNGPTATGVSYPKYYLWTKALSGNHLISEGAARVAAIDQQHFEVINFLAADDIDASPAQVEQLFPASLVDKIIAKAAHR